MPEFLKQYFWDIEFAKLDYKKHPKFVIERIMEFGDEKVIRWMMDTFSRAQIISALEKSRHLTPKSANFWAFIFEVNEEKIKCLSRSFRETRKQFWPY